MTYLVCYDCSCRKEEEGGQWINKASLTAEKLNKIRERNQLAREKKPLWIPRKNKTIDIEECSKKISEGEGEMVWKCLACQERRKRKNTLRKEKRKKKQNFEKRIVAIEEHNTYFKNTIDKILTNFSIAINKLGKGLQKTKTEVDANTKKIYDADWQDSRLQEIRERKELAEIKDQAKKTIYRLNDAQHIIGWIAFIFLAPYTFLWFRKLKKKAIVSSKYPIDEVNEEFRNWRLSIYSSLLSYVTSFILIEQAITKWVRPNARWLMQEHRIKTTFSITTLLLGSLYVLDSIISSSMKVYLQRLSYRVEKVVDDKESKGDIFFKTQDSTETLKEDFKRFGLTAIPNILTGLFGSVWINSWFSYGAYFIPVVYATIRIFQVEWRLKKLKKEAKRKSIKK